MSVVYVLSVVCGAPSAPLQPDTWCLCRCFPEERKKGGEEVRRGRARTGRKSTSGCEGTQGRGGGLGWTDRGSQVTPGPDVPPLMSVQQGAAPASPTAAVCVDGGLEALARVP